jgi:hypothetical protein
MLVPKIDKTLADTLVEFYKNPTEVELPQELGELAKQISQIKMLFADKWKRRDIVEHLKAEWGLAERVAYDRINLAVRCFPDITEAYIDFEIQLLLDAQLDAMNLYMGTDPKAFIAAMKERRLLLSFLKTRVENKEDYKGKGDVITNYIVIQNNGGQPTKVSEHDLAEMDIDARNVVLKRATQNMLPIEFAKLLPQDNGGK